MKISLLILRTTAKASKMAGYILKDASGNALPVAGQGTSSQSGASYTYSPGDGNVVLCTNTAAQTVTLPTAASAANVSVTFCDGNKGWGSNPTIIIPDGSETINGGSSFFCGTKNSEVTLVSNGTNWFKSAGDKNAYQSDFSVEFDGVDESATCADNSDLDITTSLSISVWYRPTASGSSNFRTILSKRTSDGSDCNYQIYLSNAASAGQGAISFYARTSSTDEINVSTTVPAVDSWHHAVVTIATGTSLILYSDASSVKTATLSNAIAVNSGGFALGKAGEQNAEYFQGQITQVCIWDSVLTSGNVTTLYNSGVPIDPRRIDPTNVKACWFCGDGESEGSGLTVYNGENNNNNLTLNNGADFSTTSP